MNFASKVLYFNFSWFTCRICGEFLNFLRKSCDRQFVEVSLQCSCRCSYLLLQSRLTSQGHLYHDELVSGKTLSDPLRWISLIINKSMRSMKRAFHIWIESRTRQVEKDGAQNYFVLCCNASGRNSNHNANKVRQWKNIRFSHINLFWQPKYSLNFLLQVV